MDALFLVRVRHIGAASIYNKGVVTDFVCSMGWTVPHVAAKGRKAASAIADGHGSGEVAAKIQAHVIMAVV